MQLVGMVTELSNHVCGVLKVFGLVLDGARGGVAGLPEPHRSRAADDLEAAEDLFPSEDRA